MSSCQEFHKTHSNLANRNCRWPAWLQQRAETCNHLVRLLGSACFSQYSGQHSSLASCCACFQLAKTFVAHCVDLSVVGRTYFCCAASASFFKTNWKRLEFSISPRVKHFFLTFGGWLSFLQSLGHLEHLSTLGQEQSTKSPRHKQKQPGSMELILATAR